MESKQTKVKKKYRITPDHGKPVPQEQLQESNPDTQNHDQNPEKIPNEKSPDFFKQGQEDNDDIFPIF